jgi:fumarylacetoacetate (FAA) hydrolase family protein
MTRFSEVVSTRGANCGESPAWAWVTSTAVTTFVLQPHIGDGAGAVSPELAVLLGERHRVLAVTLANDLTAVSIEMRGRTEESDGTFLGKAWRGSGSLGPRFLSPEEAGDLSDLRIGLGIVRGGRVVYDRSYSMSRSLYPLAVILDMIVACRRGYGDNPPPSKRIAIDDEGFLRPGTVVMLGTGLITEGKYYCEPGDVLSVYSPRIGTLTNVVTAGTPEDAAFG